MPTETWAFNEPLLHLEGKPADLGAIAEALVYYERAKLVITTPNQLVALIQWALVAGELDSLMNLLCDGALSFVYFDFATTAVYDPRTDTHTLVNIRDEEAVTHPLRAFERKVAHRATDQAISNSRRRKRFLRALRDSVLEIKADQYGRAIDDATKDSVRSEVVIAALQPVVDEIWPAYFQAEPVPVSAAIAPQSEQPTKITINVNFEAINSAVRTAGFLHDGSVLIAIAQANRNLWTAAREGTDLYSRGVTGSIVSSKIVGAVRHNSKLNQTLSLLQAEVEYPDIAVLVNQGNISFRTVLRLRDASSQFRPWVHSVSETNRDKLSAYHNDVVHITGFKPVGRKAVRFLGRLASAAAGTGVGLVVGADRPVTAGLLGTAVTVVGDHIVSTLTDYLSKLGESVEEGWRPVLFGDWAKSVVARQRDSNQRIT
ncbi:MAG: hypothetical protein AB1792_02285 [Candidatus Zixiibacteriota bacterium]